MHRVRRHLGDNFEAYIVPLLPMPATQKMELYVHFPAISLLARFGSLLAAEASLLGVVRAGVVSD